MALIKYILLLTLISQPLHAQDSWWQTVIKPAIAYYIPMAILGCLILDQTYQIDQLKNKSEAQEKKIKKLKNKLNTHHSQIIDLKNKMNMAKEDFDRQHTSLFKQLSGNQLFLGKELITLRKDIADQAHTSDQAYEKGMNKIIDAYEKFTQDNDKKMSQFKKSVTATISTHYDKTLNGADLVLINDKLDRFFKIMGKNHENN